MCAWPTSARTKNQREKGKIKRLDGECFTALEMRGKEPCNKIHSWQVYKSGFVI